MIRPSMIQGTPVLAAAGDKDGQWVHVRRRWVGAVSGVAAICDASTTCEVPSFAALFVHVMNRHRDHDRSGAPAMRLRRLFRHRQAIVEMGSAWTNIAPSPCNGTHREEGRYKRQASAAASGI
jgi:hypothetical protein